jgi:hypothetical protein
MKSAKETTSEISRRDFARAAALAATVAVLPVPAMAQSAPPSELPKEVVAEIEAKYAEILRLYGAKLSPEQKAEVRKQLEAQVPGLQKLRAYALSNSDAPAAVLRLASEKE